MPGVWLLLNGRSRKPPVEVTSTCDWPPIVQEDLERAPIRDPSQDQEAFFHDPPGRRVGDKSGHEICREQTSNQNRDAYRKRSPADPKQLVEVALNGGCPIREVFAERIRQVSRQVSLGFIIRKVNDNPEWPVSRQFPGPSHDIFFGLPVEVLLPKWKRIKRVEKLSDLIDADLDDVFSIFRGHRFVREFPPALAAD
ncbi:hypothetical protein [Bradyrhizobium sp.]|uniref:hypothetical protein n=1 Tax=Bradyrhizobium sp. TaxID=376 RepID=UPI002D80BA1F|nr:hypothetical protein [Bradyrhizobium sp.]